MTDDRIKIVRALREASKIALFSHGSPDGDGIGSMLAAGAALTKMHKEVSLYNSDGVPPNLAFLPDAHRVQRMDGSIPPADTFLLLDCAELARVNLQASDWPSETVVINIDHHISNNSFGDLNWVDAQAAATGELVYQLIRDLGLQLDEVMATNLYTAVVTDTGGFLYSNTTPQSHYLAAELMELIDVADINTQLFAQQPLAYIKLLQKALSSLEIMANHQLAVMTLRWQDFLDCGAEESLSEGIVNYARDIAGVEVGILVRETQNGEVKIGFRAKSWLNVNEVAAQLRGGGHKRAAGCALDVTLPEARAMAVSLLREALDVGRVY
ncbi:MAG: bifunctional oligoribonuclease/PAP phosphatase NrnA [Peptococcaceae bacterium]|jgi:phosphoesterase RecJ-like protein|nr:bifunctional oligoribonuclease/PAP phosphatase NrnA [Peptococcaceae bacterium]